MKTLQEVFTISATHLLRQNAKSMAILKGDGSPSCAYRGDDGMMCAVGCLIPDELYDPSLEGKTADSLIVSDALGNAGIVFAVLDGSDPMCKLLGALQSIHDSCDSLFWYKHLSKAAEHFNLEMPNVA
jgi:hypothetical protein